MAQSRERREQKQLDGNVDIAVNVVFGQERDATERVEASPLQFAAELDEFRVTRAHPLDHLALRAHYKRISPSSVSQHPHKLD